MTLEQAQKKYPLNSTIIVNWYCDTSFHYTGKKDQPVDFSHWEEIPCQDTKDCFMFVKYDPEDDCYEEWYCWKLNFYGYFTDKNNNTILTTYSQDFGIELFNPDDFDHEEYGIYRVEPNIKKHIAESYFSPKDIVFYNIEDLKKFIAQKENLPI